MFRRHRGAWGPVWRVAFALVPAVIAAAVLLSSGEAPPSGSSRLEVTGGESPLFPDFPATATSPDEAALGGLDGAFGAAAVDEGASAPVEPAAGGEAGAVDADAGAGTGPAATSAASPAERPDPAAGAGGDTRGTGSSPTSTSTTARPAATPAAQERATTTTRPAEVVTTTKPAPVPRGPVRSPGVESQVVPLTNADRSDEGLSPLSRNACLDGVASGYAEQMARSGVMAHNPGAGSAITGCRPGAAWGDNVGYAVPCSASVLEERWIVSPPHRRNILSPAFRHIGVGAWTDESGTCWVQVLFSS